MISAPATFEVLGICYVALYLLLTCDLGQRTDLPLDHPPPPTLPLLPLLNPVTLLPLCRCIETVPSIKMTLWVSLPKVKVWCWGSYLLTPYERLIPSNSADHNPHILNSTHQLQLLNMVTLAKFQDIRSIYKNQLNFCILVTSNC